MNPYALLDPFVQVLYALLVRLADLLPIGAAGPRLAVALALTTVAVRALLLPVAIRSLRHRRAVAALGPRLAAVRERYADDPRQLLDRTAAVYRQAGVSPLSGLSAGLLQLPVVMTLYRLVLAPTVAGAPNLLLTGRLFGAPMAAHWPEVIAVGGVLGPGTVALVCLVVLLLVLAATTSRDLAHEAALAAPQPPAGRPVGGPDPATIVARVSRLLPYGTVLFALVAPVAVAGYLLVTSAWTVAERRLLARWVPA